MVSVEFTIRLSSNLALELGDVHIRLHANHGFTEAGHNWIVAKPLDEATDEAMNLIVEEVLHNLRTALYNWLMRRNRFTD
jgi:hypothetical protein